MSGDVQSVVRTARLLEALRAEGPLGISDLAEHLELPGGTVHRLVRTLVTLGLAQQSSDRRYGLGVRLVALGAAANEALGARARPVLQDLVRSLKESANLAMLSGARAEYVAQVAGPRSMRMFTEVGSRVPLHSTGVGKAMLATLDNEAVLRLLDARGMPQATPRTIVDPDGMLQELSMIRGRGYAIDDEEMETGVRCVAAAFRGPAPMAVSISGPSGRLPVDTVAQTGALVRRAADTLESLFATA